MSIRNVLPHCGLALCRNFLTAVAAMLGLAAFGNTIYVDCNSAAETPDGSQSAPFNTIADGIAAADAATADEVVIADGTYEITTPILVNKAITVRSASDDPSKVTINANLKCRVMEFTVAGAMVRGLRMLNGGAPTGGSGGGVLMSKNGTLKNCIVESCRGATGGAAGNGCGVYINSGSTVSGCIIKNCHTGQNGEIHGLGVYVADGVLTNSLVTGCYRSGSLAKNAFGAVRLAKGTVAHCTIANNNVSGCGGLDINDAATCIVKDTVVWGNTGAKQSGDGAPNIKARGSKIIFANVCSSYAFDASSFAQNPMFADAANGDFSLLPGSPCIGAASDGGDIGCIPYDATGDALGIRTSAFGGVDSQEVAVSLHASGSYSLDGATVSWDGLEVTGTSFIRTFGAGRHVLTAHVTFADSTETTVTLADPILITTTSNLYVDADSAIPTPPYTSAQTAAKTIAEAMVFANQENAIFIAPGTYTSAEIISLSRPLKLIGTGAVTNVTVRNSNGGAFYMNHSGALISGVRIYNSQSQSVGGGVEMSAGTVSNCVIQACKSSTNQDAGGISMSGGLVTHCMLTGNMGYSYAKGGGIYMSNGTVDNCLIVNNGNSGKRTSSNNLGGGIYMTGGLVKNCTVAGNTAYGGGGIYRSGGSVVNTILFGNDEGGSDHIGKPDWQGASATAWSNCCFSATSTATGAEPQTVSSAPYLSDWSLDPQNGACCINAGANAYVTAALDYLGQPRIFGSSVDIGAIEYCVESVTPGYQTSAFIGVGELTVGLHATITGADESEFSYAWYFDGDESEPALRGQNVTNTFTAIGGHSVKLVATRGGTDYATDWSDAQYFKVLPTDMYVSRTGSETFPYDTPETAATNIYTVIDVAQGPVTVHIAEGQYRLTRQIPIIYDVKILGAGMDKTVIYGNQTFRIFDVNSKNAVLADLCISNGCSYGGGVYLHGSGGLVTRCLITKCKGSTNQAGGGFVIEGANSFVSRCIISKCAADRTNSGGSDISNYGGGISMSNGRVDDCLIIGCEADGGAAVHMSGGELWNCVITGNTCWNAGNTPKNLPGGINIFGGNGRVYNCILWKNTTDKLAEDNPGNDANGLSQFTNCFLDSARNWTVTGTDAVVSADPGFRDAANGDYRISTGSPCARAGRYEAWMAGATDFFGNPRSTSSGKVSIGFHQTQGSGTLVIIR